MSGAFDRASADRLVDKLKAKGINNAFALVLSSWLAPRTAHVVVDGVLPDAFELRDMVFQGTVLGPPLWNVYYADARGAILQHDFIDAVFADDLNCWRTFPGTARNDTLLTKASECQAALHAWGDANQVVFEPTKESTHILDTSNPHGDPFKILGVLFDPCLNMHLAVQHIATEGRWRLRALLRTRRFYRDCELVRLYKCHILSYVEGATPAIYHAKRGTLQQLDNLQDEFLNDVGISDVAALCEDNLAPFKHAP